MLSEMTAMNSTLLLLNALALAVLVIFHFQPEPATAEQYVHTYNKPLAPLPQVAVISESMDGILLIEQSSCQLLKS